MIVSRCRSNSHLGANKGFRQRLLAQLAESRPLSSRDIPTLRRCSGHRPGGPTTATSPGCSRDFVRKGVMWPVVCQNPVMVVVARDDEPGVFGVASPARSERIECRLSRPV